MADNAGPYAQAAELYWRGGWRGVLPLPYGQKTPPPHGFTGADGRDPSLADIMAWLDGPEAAGNIALRLPPGVIGLDVDAYGSKAGAATFLAASQRWGALPATVRTTSRSDGVSGIYLYSVPVDLVRWPGELGPGVEIIQYRHRYAVCAPSMHPSGTAYQWLIGPSAVPEPNLFDLPRLPGEWIAGLQAEVGRDPVRSDAAPDLLADWARTWAGGELCHAVASALGNAQQQLIASTRSRHDTAVSFAAGIARMAGEGHVGVDAALRSLGETFCAMVVKDGTRRADEAGAEWFRLLDGALRLAMHEHPEPVAVDPCTDPFAGLIEDRPAASAQVQLGRLTEREPQPAESVPAGHVQPMHPSDSVLMGFDSGTVPPSGPVLSNMLHNQGVEAGGQPAAHVDADLPGAMPAGPQQGTLSPEQQQIQAMRGAAAAQEMERQLAQRTARRLLDDAEAAGSWREPLYVRDLAAELELPDDPIRYTVAELLPAGGNVLLAAQFKAGKTTLMLNLLRSLTEGTAFLGEHPVPVPRRTAYWNYEVDRGQFRRWLRDAGPLAGHMATVLTLRGYTIPLTTPKGADWAVRQLETAGTQCWIIDPFARAFTGQNENDNTEVGRFLEALDTIKSRAGVLELVMPAHTGRAAHEQGSERVRGATRLDDWTDVRWMLNVDSEGRRWFKATGRDVETAERELLYDNGSRLMQLTDNIRENAGKTGKSNIKMAEKNAAVLNAVIANPGESMNGIGRALSGGPVSMGREALKETLKLLEDRGLIHSDTPKGRSGDAWFPGGRLL